MFMYPRQHPPESYPSRGNFSLISESETTRVGGLSRLGRWDNSGKWKIISPYYWLPNRADSPRGDDGVTAYICIKEEKINSVNLTFI